jgi:ABC-type xylose transport system permease subunit
MAPATATTGAAEENNNGVESTKHPTALLVHVVFKCSAILVYVFCNWFSDDFVVIFVLLTLLLTMDFWWTKNVSGRLLVGLRYWNEVEETSGESKWQFESRDADGMRLVDAAEKRIFWWTIYGAPLIWAFFLTTSLTKLNFNYAMVCLMALGMLLTNTIGYMKCSKDQREQISGLAQRGALSFLTRGYF